MDSEEILEAETLPLLGQVQEVLIKYPRSLPFIIFNEFCERFNYYGLRKILLLYLIKLNYNEDSAAIIFHLSATFAYLCSIFGAIIADGWLGKYKTIFWFSIVYAVGCSVVAIGSVEPWRLPSKKFTLVGLALTAIGSGGIKPCVSAFGGEQFKLPEQANQLVKFFSIFYFFVNIGSVLTDIVTPLLVDTSCFGMSKCFPAGFGLPAILMVSSIIIFVSGQSMYKKIRPQGNMLVKVCMCIGNAISNWKYVRDRHPRNHWLDYAEQKYGRQLVNDTKKLLNILVLFLPLPIFWALLEQQSSRWTEQALKMHGDIGFYTNPILVIILIPICEFIFYPLLSLVGIRRPLQKMSLGGILAGVAFIISMVLQLRIENFEEKSISKIWQLPQYTLMALAEVIFSVTGLEFSFTEAPDCMKSVVQACWMVRILLLTKRSHVSLTVAFGNMIVMAVVGSQILEKLSMEFLFFAILMFVDILVFMWLAYRFKQVFPENDERSL